jgi:hypothetical protein
MLPQTIPGKNGPSDGSCGTSPALGSNFSHQVKELPAEDPRKSPLLSVTLCDKPHVGADQVHHAGLDSRCWLTRGASLREPGRQLYSVQFDLHDSADGAWLQAPGHRNVLVIGGDYLNFTAQAWSQPKPIRPGSQPWLAATVVNCKGMPAWGNDYQTGTEKSSRQSR